MGDENTVVPVTGVPWLRLFQANVVVANMQTKARKAFYANKEILMSRHVSLLKKHQYVKH